jgi:HD-like signal output (HDOD) protein/prolyl-tRNA editing enzyme YbaK/EbsC (Cys-tRNA(Pro) deacylase)
MALPAAIDDVLRQHAIDYRLLDADNTLRTQALRSSVLQDSNGKVQIIHPGDRLLDIDSLNRELKRELKMCNAQAVKELCGKQHLDHCPALPGILPLFTVIDSALQGCDEFTLPFGQDGQLMRLDSSQFDKLCQNVSYANLTIALEQLQSGSLDAVDDVEQITTAVANFTQLRIKTRLEETLEFPPLPETAQRIIKLRVDPNADVQDLTDIVEADPALAAQVVSWAASPYYAAPGKIKSVHDAIVRVLGFDLVLNLSLGLSLGKTLSLPKDAVKGFTPYWEQAVYAATAVEALVGAIPPKERPPMGLAYLSGLLHNFGYLVLAEVFPPHFSNICRYQEANPFANHSYIERHLIGVTREQLGGWLMRLWQIPDEVCTALRFQNESSYGAEDSTYANLLFIALRLLRQHGIGDAPLEPVPQAMYQRLHLDPIKAEAVIANVMEASTEINMIASNMAA